MSKLFSFRYNSSSLRFDLTPWQFQNIMFIPMKTDIRYLSREMAYRGVRLFGDSLVSKSRGGGL